MTEPLAESRGATRRFGDHVAVDRVNLSVRPGEVVGLLGANGAGKTTLLRMLLGLLPASSGEVRLFGAAPSRATRQRIGYVPQSLGLYDDLTARENLRFAAAVFHSAPGTLPESLAAETLPLARLPLGTQRRVAFVQALAHHPDLLILDEPTSGVDPLMRARLWEVIRDASDGGMGVLVTTHYMEEAEECDRLVVMAEGRVVAEGDLPQILGEEQVVVVETDDWAAALQRMEEGAMAPALVGRTLRIAGHTVPEVEHALVGMPCTVREAPATLEERFVQITSAASRSKRS
ncbi:MAG: ABC transporter ATP-binding protein [Thermaerobacter sp.]|nr:ABC transporter ATP-binding protein [Thermaerobacter sp.]